MIPLTIGVAIMVFLLIIASRFSEPIHDYLERNEEMVEIDEASAKVVIEGCELLMEIHSDPQSDEHRTAMELKLKLERMIYREESE